MTTDKELCRQEDDWPRWPLLPLKRSKGDPKWQSLLGFILAGHGPRVFIGNIYSLPENLNTLPTEEYDSFDAMLEDWRVN